MRANTVKEKLARGEYAYGTMIFEFNTTGIGRIVGEAEVVVGAEVDELAAVGEPHRGFARALDHVEVRDHVAGVVPDEAATAAARHREHVARPEVLHLLARGDEHHRGARLLEQRDRGLLVRGKFAARQHGPRRRFLAQAERRGERRPAAPQRHRDEHGDAEQHEP